MPIPKKLLSRKDEITADFLNLMETHIVALMDGRDAKRYSATDYGALLFIHPRHLTNTLRLTTGKSTCDFMEERIVAEAIKLLLETNMPIAEIGYRFAYDDATNFTKFFKGMTGTTPLQYRKQNKLVPEN
ncbi:MAG: AraC family transcriptional regulator [Flavobacterium sp.]|nr:MAG: AraC family transcriptional regulator [Flavobacterium sp.]